MNALFDDNVVKEYVMTGIPLIHISPNDYEIVKIFTQLALNKKIDSNGKSKIIHYLANEIGQLKSKKPVNYYYTDIKK